MKKQILVMAMALMLSFGAMAQGKLQFKAFDGTITGGVKFAMNLPHFWGGSLPHGFRNGGQVGLFAEYRFNKPELSKWSIAPELVFSSQGGKFKVIQAVAKVMGEKFEFQGMAAALDKELVITSNYINIPIMVKYRLSPFFSVEAGPQVGFNVYNKIKIDGVDGNLDLDRVSHTVDLGLGAGATYYLTDYVMFHVRYNMDFLNSYKYIDDKNGNIQIGASYRF
ncbi:MAG: PorT family protein [Bacteroidales bacterium]|nr:PorT family protein [Bacteroidales bacterium]